MVKKDAPVDLGELHREALDAMVSEKGKANALKTLEGLKVVKLRNLAH